MSQIRCILCVDDEPLALKYLQRGLSSLGCILTASSAEEACKLLERSGGEVDILLSDDRMPGETGTNLLRHVKKKYPWITCILTSAYCDTDAMSHTAAGIDKFIAKPWRIEIVRSELASMLVKSSCDRERWRLE